MAAATSIAKLAILLTADARQLSTGLRSAQTQLKQMKDQEAQLKSQNIKNMAAALIALGLVVKATSVAFRFASGEALDFQQRLAELTGKDRLDTFVGQWELFGKTIGRGFLPTAEAATRAIRQLNTGIDALVVRMTGKLSGAPSQQLKFFDAFAKAEEDRLKALDAMGKAAERIKEEIREPIDSTDVRKFAKEAADVLALQNFGLLDKDQASQAMRLLGKELFAATAKFEEMQESLKGPAAAEQNTQGALSAINAARAAATARLIEQQRRQQLIDKSIKQIGKTEPRDSERFAPVKALSERLKDDRAAQARGLPPDAIQKIRAEVAGRQVRDAGNAAELEKLELQRRQLQAQLDANKILTANGRAASRPQKAVAIGAIP